MLPGVDVAGPSEPLPGTCGPVAFTLPFNYSHPLTDTRCAVLLSYGPSLPACQIVLSGISFSSHAMSHGPHLSVAVLPRSPFVNDHSPRSHGESRLYISYTHIYIYTYISDKSTKGCPRLSEPPWSSLRLATALN